MSERAPKGSRAVLPSPELNKIFILFNLQYPRETSSLNVSPGGRRQSGSRREIYTCTNSVCSDSHRAVFLPAVSAGTAWTVRAAGRLRCASNPPADIKPPSSGQAICDPKTFFQNGWLLMSLIPCTSQCVYQQDGVCTLDSAAAAGVPSLGGACVHFIPANQGRLGSPHRYSRPEAAPDPEAPSAFRSGAAAPDTGGSPDDGSH